MNVIRVVLIATAAVLAAGSTPARADVDLTGKWVFQYFGGVVCLDFVQTGTTLSATHCDNTDDPFTGTIDPMTGVFSITQPPFVCTPASGVYCQLSATAAPDGNSFSGAYECFIFSTSAPPPDFCLSIPETVAGAHETCGNAYTNTTEECDDGDTTAGDGCGATCLVEPCYVCSEFPYTSVCTPDDGASCDDGDSCTSGETCSGGLCSGGSDICPLNHYLCYQGKDLKTPPFVPQIVTLADQITSEAALVQRLRYVCTPVEKNGEPIENPNAHLSCYQIKVTTLSPRPRLQVSTQFQTSQFEAKKGKLLCLPSTKTVIP